MQYDLTGANFCSSNVFVLTANGSPECRGSSYCAYIQQIHCNDEDDGSGSGGVGDDDDDDDNFSSNSAYLS